MLYISMGLKELINPTVRSIKLRQNKHENLPINLIIFLNIMKKKTTKYSKILNL